MAAKKKSMKQTETILQTKKIYKETWKEGDSWVYKEK